MLKRLSLVLFVSIFTLAAKGQETSIDSLQLALSNARTDIKRVDILNEISFYHYDYDVNKGLEYAVRALELARKANYPEGARYALILKGYYYFETGEYQTALNHYTQARRVKLPDDALLGYCQIMTGNVHRSLAHYDSAETFYHEGIRILRAFHSAEHLAYGYKSLGRLYLLQWKNKEARVVFEKALHIYDSTRSEFGIADALFGIAEVNVNFADYAAATERINTACEIGSKLNDKYLQLHCLIYHGEVHYNLGENNKALESLLAAVDILKTRELPQTLARVYIDLGDIYESIGQNDVALQYYLEALKISEKLGLKEQIASVYGSMAWIYKNQHNFTLAHEYVDKSLKLRLEIRDEKGLSFAYNVLGIIYLVQKRYNLAVVNLEKALDIRKRIGHVEGVSACLYNLGLVFEEQKQFQKALQYQREALRIDLISGNKYSLGISYNSMGTLHSQLGQYDSARYYLTLAQKLAGDTKSLNVIMNNAYYWSEYFEKRGELAEALKWHKRYATLNDSIYYENSAKKLAEMQALYQADQKDQQIRLLNQEKFIQSNQLELQQAQIRSQYIVIGSGIAGFVLVSLLALKTYQYNRRIRKVSRAIKDQKEEIEAQSHELKVANKTIADINTQLEAKVEERTAALRQAYKELDTFFYRSSHDFRRPLTTFFGLAEVAKITVKDPNALELFTKIRETAGNLDKMLVKLQSISDLGGQELVYKEVFLKEVLDEMCDNFRDQIDLKGIKIYSHIDLKQPFYSYPALVKIIVENLIENSISFSCRKHSFIKLNSFENGENVILEVEDNGEGIDEQYHDRIFDMYFRGSERSKGNGLGLYIVRKAVEKLDGKICFQSEFDKGTTFRIVLPRHHHTAVQTKQSAAVVHT